jgi:hypothetical protein
MMRALLALALAGLAMPAAAFAQRPCVDYVGRGALQSVGDPEPLNLPDDVLGHSIYRYRFTERSALFGHSRGRAASLMRAEHSPGPVDRDDVAIFMTLTGKRARFNGWELIWKDLAGEPFIPILNWPDPDNRETDWRPMAIRQFARAVSYQNPQPYWGAGNLDYGPADDALYVTRGGHRYVRYGLYLSDLPAMFRAARAERCRH